MIKEEVWVLGSALLITAVVVAMAARTVRAQTAPPGCTGLGCEVAVPVHLQDGQELAMSPQDLAAFGRSLFTAMFTIQEGAGRPQSKGTGNPLSNPASPLVFPQNFNRISAPDTNSCSGCHNKPIVGGGGDIVGNVFVLGQRFDFATFNGNETIPTANAMDERGLPVTLQSIANSPKTVGMVGSGFIEMLARQMTADMQAIMAATPPGTSSPLITKGISFGRIIHNADGTWDTSQVQGIPAPSLTTSGTTAPSRIIRSFHQAGNVISVRQFTDNAFNHHHGMQAEERFGVGVDADQDGFVNELTTADITAATIFQVTLQVPGRVINTDPTIQAAIVNGEAKFVQIGCTTCHVANLPLDNNGWIYTEPNPYNPPGNLQLGTPAAAGYPISVDLTSNALPHPRLRHVHDEVLTVPAYTDLKLHNITNGTPGPNGPLDPSGSLDPNCELLDQNQPSYLPGTSTPNPKFFYGNCSFITRKLWGIANQHSFGHHGLYTTMREAVLAHAGEAQTVTNAFNALPAYDQNSIIEFLKSLQILLGKGHSLCEDQKMNDIACPAGVQP